jgi:hypothetical protein
MGKGWLVSGNLVVDYRMMVGDHAEVGEEHDDKELVVLLVSLTSHAHAIIGKVKS